MWQRDQIQEPLLPCQLSVPVVCLWRPVVVDLWRSVCEGWELVLKQNGVRTWSQEHKICLENIFKFLFQGIEISDYGSLIMNKN